MTPNLPKYKLERVITATPRLLVTGSSVVKAILLCGGSANADVKLFNTVDGSGTDTISVSCLAYDSQPVDLEDLGGVIFPSYLYVTPSGTGAVAYIWFEN